MLNKLGLSGRQAKAKDLKLRKDFGFGLQEYYDILVSQNWLCPICHKQYEPGKRWAVDHEHKDGNSGPVRGVVCLPCNRYRIGKHTIQIVDRLWEYFHNPPAYNILGEHVADPPKAVRRRHKRNSNKGS